MGKKRNRDYEWLVALCCAIPGSGMLTLNVEPSVEVHGAAKGQTAVAVHRLREGIHELEAVAPPFYNPERATVVRDLLSKLSEDAKMAMKVLLELPIKDPDLPYTSKTTKKDNITRNSAKKYLRKYFGYSWSRSESVIKELEHLFIQLAF